MIKPGLIACALLASFVFYSCLRPEVYPIEPQIKFLSFEQMGDSGRIAFSFTDGDGDIGYSENEGQENIAIHYYEKVNGTWQSGATIPFSYKTVNITPTGKNKALKGQIIIYLVPTFYNWASDDSDTVKFDIQLVDRAEHVSNIVETGEIIRN